MSRMATKALLNAIKNDTVKNRCNRMLLIFLYDSVALVQESADLMTGDIHIDGKHPFITLTGKGDKTRNVPLTQKTALHLKQYLKEFHKFDLLEAPLFYSKRDGKPQPLSTDSISIILKKAAELAREACPDIPRDVYCHLIRNLPKNKIQTFRAKLRKQWRLAS